MEKVIYLYRNEILLFRKEVDWALFNEGICLPKELNNIFGQAKDGTILKEGQSKTIRVYLDGNIYYAKIINTIFYKNKKEFKNLQLKYSKNSDLSNKFKELFKYSYEFYIAEMKSGKRSQSITKLSEDKKEYISIFSTKYLDIYYLEATKSFDNSKEMVGNHLSTGTMLSKDIQKLVYEIDNNQNKKDNWIRYIINFHEVWKKQYKGNMLIYEGKYIWGKKLLMDSSTRITDVFNKSIDNKVVKFFNMKNKNLVNEIEEEDLIQLMFQNNFGFINFKRTINVLFSNNEKVEDNEIIEDEISIVDRSQNVTMKKANKSIDNIKGELTTIGNVINYYESTIIKLKDTINSKDKEINMQKNTIDDLVKELKESSQALGELENINKNLREIKGLLEKDSLF